MLKKLIATTVLIFVLVVFIFYPLTLAAMGDGDFPSHLSAYDSDFDDLSLFKSDLDSMASQDTNGDDMDDYLIRSVVATPNILKNQVKPKNSLLVINGVEKRMDASEIEAVSDFVAEGGRLIMADDYGYANDFSKHYGVTFYGKQFYELESYDLNSNYTVSEAYLGTDRGSEKEWDPSLENWNVIGEPDRLWDDDDDGDLKTDEDPGDLDDTNDEDDSSDDDYDNSIRTSDGRDNNGNGHVDEEFEGIDEDGLDDDGDWRAVHPEDGQIWHDIGMDGIGEYDVFTREPNEEWSGPDYGEGNGLPDKGEPFVNEENLNGVPDKTNPAYGWYDPDDRVDEDLRSYRLVMYKPTGLLTTNKSYIVSHGTHNSYVDLNGDGRITIASDELFETDENVDKPSFPGNEIRLIVKVVVTPDGEVVDPVTGKVDPGNEAGRVYTPAEMQEFGQIVFLASSSMFTNDLYTLNHMTLTTNYDPVEQEGNPFGYGVPARGVDSPESYFDAKTNQMQEVDKNNNGRIEDDDGNGVLDNTPDYYKDGRPIPDYDNRDFLMTLVRSMLPSPEEGEESRVIIFDESRHSLDSPFVEVTVGIMATIAFLTSDPMYSLLLTITLVVLFLFAFAFTREKEDWIHNYNLHAFRGRGSFPNTQKLQSTRVHRALLEKLRMQRGLSPEEFQALPQNSVLTMVKDPELRELLENPDRVYTQERLRVFIDKIGRIGQ